MSSEISDLKVSIGIFNEFSRNEFLRRYHEYFQTNIDLEYRPVFTVYSNWFNEGYGFYKLFYLFIIFVI
jgi:hypothetical protein